MYGQYHLFWMDLQTLWLMILEGTYVELGSLIPSREMDGHEYTTSDHSRLLPASMLGITNS